MWFITELLYTNYHGGRERNEIHRITAAMSHNNTINKNYFTNNKSKSKNKSQEMRSSRDFIIGNVDFQPDLLPAYISKKPPTSNSQLRVLSPTTTTTTTYTTANISLVDFCAGKSTYNNSSLDLTDFGSLNCLNTSNQLNASMHLKYPTKFEASFMTTNSITTTTTTLTITSENSLESIGETLNKDPILPILPSRPSKSINVVSSPHLVAPTENHVSYEYRQPPPPPPYNASNRLAGNLLLGRRLEEKSMNSNACSRDQGRSTIVLATPTHTTLNHLTTTTDYEYEGQRNRSGTNSPRHQLL